MSLPSPGQAFGRWKIEAVAGSGGYGVVYRARDDKLGRDVALKVLKSDDGDPDDAARFLREARVCAALSHPGIVTIYDVEEVDGVLAIAMEWIEGRTLRKLVELGSLSLSAKQEILLALAEALAHAHERGVVHRDLKPANVLVGRDGRARIVDFGLGKQIASRAQPHPLTFETKEDIILGTWSYMAPEQSLSSNVDGRADQFSWGVMAYELLGGAHPRTASDPAAPFPSSPAKPLRGVSSGLAAVVRRAMEVHPADRFASMGDVATALRDEMAAASAVPAAPPPPERPPERATNHALVFGVSFAAMITLGGIATWTILARRTPPLPAPPVSSAPVSSAPAPSALPPVASSLPPVEPSAVSAGPPSASEMATASAPSTSPPPAWRPHRVRLGFPFYLYIDADSARRELAKREPALLACFLASPPVRQGALVRMDVVISPEGDIVRVKAEASCATPRLFAKCEASTPRPAVASCVAGVLTGARLGPVRPSAREHVPDGVSITYVGQDVAVE